jgi:hypothetical protein
MRITLFLKIFAGAVVLALMAYLAVVAYTKYMQSWQLRRLAVAVQSFHSNEGLYDQLLAHSADIMPAKCGVPAEASGSVSIKSISRENDVMIETASTAVTYSHVPNDEAARLLDVQPEVVRRVVSSLKLAGAAKIVLSGGEIMILSLENDTHGYLHIDQSCPNAANYAYWSQQPDNFKPENPGRFIGLKSLGRGWYYYVEQR